MSIPDRAEYREEIAALMTAAGDWQAVYDHQTKDFGQQSPVGMVHSGPVTWRETTFGGNGQEMQITVIVTNLVKRTDDDAAEDTLDDLLMALIELVEANQDNALWEFLSIGDTEPDYYTIDGVQYRGELIPLIATAYV